MLQYFMSNKIEIIDKKKFRDWRKIIMYAYSTISIIILIICFKLTKNIKSISICAIPCFISPIISKILTYIFSNMQIIYTEDRITQINNSPNETEFTIDMTDLATNKILTISNEPNVIKSERTYISVKYKFEPHKYIFTNVSKILKKQEVQQQIYYYPQYLDIKVHKESNITYEANMSKYQHLLNKDNQCATTIESILIPTINDAIEFAINN
jgi:hypothetical protein